MNIEDYLKEKESDLFCEELSLDHENRFEKRLNEKFHKKNSFIVRYSVAIAASVFIFLATSIYVYKTKTEGYTGAVKTSEWVEFIEAEQYYSQQTKKAELQLQQTLSAQSKDIASPLLSELDEMDTSYKQLKNDLKNNPNDIRLMSAVVQYHQLKLELINNLIDRFTLYSNTKIKTNEKGNI